MYLKFVVGILFCTFSIFGLTITDVFAEPVILDEEYEIQQIVSGLIQPTSFTFVDDYLLVTLKSGAILQVSKNGIVEDTPILDIPTLIPNCADETGQDCAPYGESGLLGITTIDHYVFVFHTEPQSESCNTAKEEYWPSENCDIKNLVVKYTISEDELINPEIIKELPVCSINHHGGAITANSNGDIYFITGDNNTTCVYDTAGSIFKYNAAGSISKDYTETFFDNIICKILSVFPQLDYILDVNCTNVEVIGKKIRNSFGLAVDPQTGFLWQTENGTDMFDEINLVQPKFSSGWEPTDPGHGTWVKKDFFNFRYSDPEFLWERSIGITGIEFPPSQTFEKYSNYVFVGDYNNGNVYKFKLNSDRNGFVFNDSSLQDNVMNMDSFTVLPTDEIPSESKEIFFVQGIPGGVVDITFHQDEMYVLSFGKSYPPFNTSGSIYKISKIIED